jgi:hypothetical protein
VGQLQTTGHSAPGMVSRGSSPPASALGTSKDKVQLVEIKIPFLQRTDKRLAIWFQELFLCVRGSARDSRHAVGLTWTAELPTLRPCQTSIIIPVFSYSRSTDDATSLGCRCAGNAV